MAAAAGAARGRRTQRPARAAANTPARKQTRPSALARSGPRRACSAKVAGASGALDRVAAAYADPRRLIARS